MCTPHHAKRVSSWGLTALCLVLSLGLSLGLSAPQGWARPTPDTPLASSSTSALSPEQVAERYDERCVRLGEALKGALKGDQGALTRQFSPIKRPSWRYRGARKRMFGDIEAIVGAGQVEALYTGKRLATRGRKAPQGMNCEHLWPRAWMGSRKRSTFKLIEADLHNLFPSEMRVNSRRGHLPFGEVQQVTYPQAAPSRLGRDARGREVMEVRPERRGDVARALLYMAARWQMRWPEPQAELLTRWSRLDPPDERERRRDALIGELQGNHNPLVACPSAVPELVRALKLP